MKKEKKSIKAISKDSIHDSSDSGALLEKNQVSISSTMCSGIDFGNLEILIHEKIKNILEADPVQRHLDLNLIKLLGDLLKIQHYNTDIFSNWILRTLLKQVIYHADTLNKCDYTLFIYWIFEEINLIRYNKDLSRENFFQLLNEIFRTAMSKILDGQGLLHPLELINQSWGEENESISKIYITKCDSDDTFPLKNNDESPIDNEIHTDPQFESTIKYFETVLHAIVTTTYTLFSKESDYMLIQIASIDEENVPYYTIPYHFQRPKVVKKVETTRKPSTILTSKQGRTRKKSKSVRKSSLDTQVLVPNKPNCFILPLSDAILCQDFTQFVEGEAKSNSDI